MKKILLLTFLFPYFIAKAQTCLPATAQMDLDVNNVRARILGGGDMWWDQGLGTAKYEVPKGSGHHTMFASSLWLGGIDAGGQIHLAAQTYRQTGNDFWPGPLDTSGQTTSTICNLYDRHWKVTKAQIQSHIANPTSPSLAISTWPAKGNNVGGGIINRDMAPFVDVNNNGIYDPTNGDYPKINGDQAIWWVINDVGNIHTESQARALGVEVQVMAYAFTTNNVLNNTTFYNYNITNKSDTIYNNFYIGYWTDSDLGDGFDDYIGYDSTRNAAIYYNADNSDTDYGTNIPIAAIAGISTPVENGVPVKMKYGGFYSNNATIQGNPSNAAHFYNYLTGKWKDGTNWASKYAYTGSPCNSSEVSMVYPTLQTPADLRTIQSFGPMTLQPNQCKNITTAVITTFNSTYPNPCFNNIRASIDSVKILHNSLATSALSCQNLTSINELNNNENDFLIYPNPTSNIVFISTKLSSVTSYSIIKIDGSIITSGKINSELSAIDTEHFSNGIYFVQLKDNSGVIFATKKLIKN